MRKVFIFFIFFLPFFSCKQQNKYDTIIRNGMIYDGNGGEPYKADIAIIADTIAFQVTEAYRNLMTARRGIELSQPEVAQAEENYRLVRARANLGDATTAEITDAASTLTRAQQAHLNSIHDYFIALSRLEFAMGSTTTESAATAERGIRLRDFVR